jgi:hypothetical protein
MANRRTTGNTFKGAIIDTAPGAAGFWSVGVKASDHKVGNMILSISGIFAGTVVLQFRPIGEPGWTNYDTTYTDRTRQIIEDYTNCEWRIGMASGGYTSGAVRLRIEYHDGEYR